MTLTDIELRAEIERICADVTAAQRIEQDRSADWADQVGAGRRRLSLYSKAERLFAASRGWRVAKGGWCGWRDLTRPTRSTGGGERPPCCDHTTLFRDADNRLAGVLSQPYGYWDIRAAGDDEALDGPRCCAQWAEEHGIGFEMPDVPSWYYPGHSVLLLWTRPDLLRKPYLAPPCDRRGEEATNHDHLLIF